MSLDKAIEHGKEKRRPYVGAKAIDCSCRNHGSCDWCKANRLQQSRKVREAVDAALREYEDGDDYLEDMAEYEALMKLEKDA